MAIPSDDRGVLVTCQSCGKTNRLAYKNLNRKGRCGHCHATLGNASAPVDIANAATFDALVSQSPIPVLVDFWAPWCGPCRMMAPEVERVAQRTAGSAVVAKVDTDAIPELGERFRIMSIPTVAVFKGGQVVARESGARPAADLEALLSRS
jgi:thioredoxin 2